MPTRAAEPGADELRREIGEFRERFPQLKDDDLFVLWFLRAFVTEDEAAALDALCGGSHDKGIDAVLIDEPARIVFVVQGKYRESGAGRTEQRNDVIGLANFATILCGEIKAFREFARKLAPEVLRRIEQARERVCKRGFELQLHFVTTGSCSAPLQEEATRLVRAAPARASFHLLDRTRVLQLFKDYLDGVAPPVPSLDLEIESGRGVRTAGVFNRYDSKTDIESWVFAMTDDAVAGLFERAGTRLFARNVRGFLGSTEINRGMEETLEKEPEYFWYYNNGITIVCDDATQESSRGTNLLRVTNPQIINGQQTTRTLARNRAAGARASVLVRVIRVPRGPENRSNGFDALVSRIVSATNWQNAIRPSDLMSNDRRQIELERQFRKLDYLYVRKRMTKGEARRAAGSRRMRLVKKEELAQCVAGCDLDPSVVREGKERLFEERWYGQIFPTSDPNYYLTRCWLMRDVAYASRGKPERAYAKWLVLNFMWKSLEPVIRSRAWADSFRDAVARGRRPIESPLIKSADAVYSAAMRFFRGKRGTGQRAIDVSTFFMRKKLHDQFERFWRTSANRDRTRFGRSWKQFMSALQAEVDA